MFLALVCLKDLESIVFRVDALNDLDVIYFVHVSDVLEYLWCIGLNVYVNIHLVELMTQGCVHLCVYLFSVIHHLVFLLFLDLAWTVHSSMSLYIMVILLLFLVYFFLWLALLLGLLLIHGLQKLVDFVLLRLLFKVLWILDFLELRKVFDGG